MNKVLRLKLLVAVMVILGLTACGDSGPYWTSAATNAAWQEDQSQMRGAHYATVFAANVSVFACDRLPEIIEKTAAYRTVWSQQEFKRGFERECMKIMQLRQATADVAWAKKMVAAHKKMGVKTSGWASVLGPSAK